jgi:ABC-type sugar transport system ATPase subunit
MNLFRGRLVTDAGVRRFEGEVAVALPTRAGSSIPDGELTLGVRPEAIDLVPESVAGVIPAVVELVESVGADQYISVSIGPAVAAVARVGANEPVAEGERVHLRFDPGGIHLFDAAGDRVPLEGESA